MSREYIVFCFEHYNPLGIVRSLGEKGIFPKIIIVKGNEKIIKNSKYAKKKNIVYVKDIESGYNYILNNFGKDKEKDIIYSSDDKIMAHLDSHYNELKKRFIFFNAQSQGRINYYMQKENIQQLAKECGFKIPFSLIINREDKLPENLTFPIITKAISSILPSWKNEVHICNNYDELNSALKTIQGDKIALQQYYKKDNEYCIDGYSYNKGKNVYIPIASTYDYLLPDYYSPLMTVKNFDKSEFYDFVKPRLDKMFEIIGFEGIFETEFLIVNHELIFLEINFRNSTWSYASTVAGMNMPYEWALRMTEKTPVKDIYVPIKEGFRGIVEFFDFRERVAKKKISYFKWLKEKNKCDCQYWKGRKDSKPYYMGWVNRILRKLHLKK